MCEGVNIKVAVQIHILRYVEITNIVTQLLLYGFLLLLYLHYSIPHCERMDFIHDFHYAQLWLPLLLHVQHLLL